MAPCSVQSTLHGAHMANVAIFFGLRHLFFHVVSVRRAFFLVFRFVFSFSLWSMYGKKMAVAISCLFIISVFSCCVPSSSSVSYFIWIGKPLYRSFFAYLRSAIFFFKLTIFQLVHFLQVQLINCVSAIRLDSSSAATEANSTTINPVENQ